MELFRRKRRADRNYEAEKDTNQTTGKQMGFYTIATNITQFHYAENPATTVPSESSMIHLANYDIQMRLGKPIMSDRGSITYETNDQRFFAKIYTLDTLKLDMWEKKTHRMLQSPISVPGIIWPIDSVLNERGRFCGIIMPASRGVQLTKSILKGKTGISAYFPAWTKADVQTLAETILSKIQVMHRSGLLFGCLNPSSIYVQSPSEIYFVDPDNWQIEGFPAVSLNLSFTPPEVLKSCNRTLMFTEDQDNYQIAVLIFMLMMPGKFPYAKRRGSDEADSIKSMAFPFNVGETMRHAEGSERPGSMWRFAWDNLPYHLCEAFYQTFSENGRYALPGRRLRESDWIPLVREIGGGVIFPDTFRRDQRRTFARCTVCGKEHPDFYFMRSVRIQQDNVDLWTRGYRVCLPCANDKSDVSFTCKHCGRTFYYTNRFKIMHEIGKSDFDWTEQRWCRDCKKKTEKCDKCGTVTSVVQLREFKPRIGKPIQVCSNCFSELVAEDKKFREEQKEHGKAVFAIYKCRDCGETFNITNDEADYYKKKGMNIPKRCKKCLAARRNGQGGTRNGG